MVKQTMSEQELDKWLAQSPEYISDDGFTDNVMQAIAAEESSVAKQNTERRDLIIVCCFIALGAAISLFQLPIGDWMNALKDLTFELTMPSVSTMIMAAGAGWLVSLAASYFVIKKAKV